MTFLIGFAIYVAVGLAILAIGMKIDKELREIMYDVEKSGMLVLFIVLFCIIWLPGMLMGFGSDER